MKSLIARLFPRPPALTPDQDAQLRAELPWLARLDPERRERLAALVALFLAGKTITPLHGLVLEPNQRLHLAALACLPLLEFGAQGLAGWSQVVVYPGAFRVHRQHHHEDTGVLEEWQEDLAGESWEHGPLVLSWDDILADLADPGAGFQLVVHEMAHKLDALDGAMDGTPPLPAPWQREWARDFQAAYDDFCALLDAGGDSPIDAYAAQAPEEFFAVTSEYHFSAPDLLAAHMPAVAGHLRRFYGASPLPAN